MERISRNKGTMTITWVNTQSMLIMKLVIKRTHVYIKPGRQRAQPLADILHSRYVITATQPVHRLQIRPIVQNYAAPPAILPSYIWLRAVVRACGRGQTDRQTDARDHYTFHVIYDSHEM